MRYGFLPSGFGELVNGVLTSKRGFFGATNYTFQSTILAPVLDDTTFNQAFEFYRKIKRLRCDWDYTMFADGIHQTGTVTGDPLGIPDLGYEERGYCLDCRFELPMVNLLAEVDFNDNLVSLPPLFGGHLYMGLAGVNDAGTLFSFFATFETKLETGFSGNFHFSGGGTYTASGITFTFLGRPIPFFSANGGLDTGTITISADAYLEFRKTDNTEPIYDQSNGTLLLPTIPKDLGD